MPVSTVIGRLGSSIPFEDVAARARFLRGVRAFLRHPFGPEEARATLRRRLERREADFLALVERAVYRHDPSPYRQLLRLAGCEYGDLERLVYQDGVEGASTACTGTACTSRSMSTRLAGRSFAGPPP